MKTTAKMIAMIFLLGAGIWLTPKEANAHYGISYQVFYDDLSPYGNWVDSPEYGFVWVPNAGPDFMPYRTSGYWTYSVYGWTWVSHYSWGWAPFHYGRWYYDNWYGWAWIPGTQWGPGWVTWRQCDGYYGWAPMSPHIDIHININWNVIPVHHWVFIPRGHFGIPGMDRYYTHRNDIRHLYDRSDFIAGTGMDRETNVRYFAGPSATDVSKATGRAIRPMEVKRGDRPGQALSDGTMRIYRPEVTAKEGNTRSTPTPQRYNDYKGKPGNADGIARNNPVPQERVTPKQQPERVTPKQQPERVSPQAQPQRTSPNQNKSVTPADHRTSPQPRTVTPVQERKPQPTVQPNKQVNPSSRPADNHQGKTMSQGNKNTGTKPAAKPAQNQVSKTQPKPASNAKTR